MTQTQNIAKHLRELYFGGNWPAVNVKDTIASITLEQANHKIEGFNTIAILVFHINYYIEGILPIFDDGKLEIRDKFSFDAPRFTTEKDWEDFKIKILKNAEILSEKISQLEDSLLSQPFTNNKYGSYYRNLNGTIEHTFYHLGQIVVLKKLIEDKMY